MGDVAGVNDERGFDRHRLHLGDGFAERAERIRVCRLIEADVAVAHLQKRESGRFGRKRIADHAH